MWKQLKITNLTSFAYAEFEFAPDIPFQLAFIGLNLIQSVVQIAC